MHVTIYIIIKSINNGEIRGSFLSNICAINVFSTYLYIFSKRWDFRTKKQIRFSWLSWYVSICLISVYLFIYQMWTIVYVIISIFHEQSFVQAFNKFSINKCHISYYFSSKRRFHMRMYRYKKFDICRLFSMILHILQFLRTKLREWEKL